VGEGGRAPIVPIILPTGAARAAAAVVAILGKLLECIEGGTLPVPTAHAPCHVKSSHVTSGQRGTLPPPFPPPPPIYNERLATPEPQYNAPQCTESFPTSMSPSPPPICAVPTSPLLCVAVRVWWARAQARGVWWGDVPPCVVGEGASAFVAQRSVSTSCGGGDGRRSVIESRARRGGHAEPFPQRCRVHREGVGSY